VVVAVPTPFRICSIDAVAAACAVPVSVASRTVVATAARMRDVERIRAFSRKTGTAAVGVQSPVGCGDR
jgi:hypothetical protein